jgi:hypothetical protein
MANSLGTNPWVVDTVMATAYKAQVKISNVVWSEQAAAGDQLVIKDQNGNVIIDIKCNTANTYETLGSLGWVNGFQVTTIGSGKLYVYHFK